MAYSFYNARKCPECSYYTSRVIDCGEGAGKSKNLWRRRRLCRRCKIRWSTIEQDESELWAMLDHIKIQGEQIRELEKKNANLRARLGSRKGDAEDL